MAGTDQSRVAEAAAPTEQPRFVLVRPQLGENIGTAARAMLNCRFDRMRLVAPRDGWPSETAVAAASGAGTVLDRAELFADTAAALQDCTTVYATTARPRGIEIPVITPREAAGEIKARLGAGERVAILFGGERAGLENDDIVRAQRIVTAPLNPAFASLNLAQAVLLVAMELHMATATPWPRREEPPAEQGQVDRMVQHLIQELEAARFFPVDEKKPRMVRNIRALFDRAQPTAQEVRTLHGIITALSGRRLDGARRGFGRHPDGEGPKPGASSPDLEA